jgi:signal recognition particle receptor subunit beta
MASINSATKEIVCKIVYYGPGMSGKTTNLQFIHRGLPETNRGQLVSLDTRQERTLFFDFLPIDLGTIDGYQTKFQLYTVPGQVFYNATRKLVLRGVDGIVFVADSQLEKMAENAESLQNLHDNLREYGYSLAEMPHVFQYNKQDLPGALSLKDMDASLNPGGVAPSIGAVACQGVGVKDTLKIVASGVLDKLRHQIANLASSQQRARADGPRRRAASDRAAAAGRPAARAAGQEADRSHSPSPTPPAAHTAPDADAASAPSVGCGSAVGRLVARPAHRAWSSARGAAPERGR